MKYCSIAAILLVLAIGCQGDLRKIFRRKRTTCSYQNHVNGCSVPSVAAIITAYEDEFGPSCNEHDVCYFCGQRYGISRATCDNIFLKNMQNYCNTITWFKYFCMVEADAFHWAVENFGEDYYVTISPNWCEDQCVQQFLGNYNITV